MRVSLREEQRELTRARLLDASVEVLGGKPYVDATIDDIAKAARVTRATVYAHFRTGKAEIIEALVDRVYGVVDQAYRDLVAQPGWHRAGVRAWLEDLVALHHAMNPTLRVLTTAASSVSAGRKGRYLQAHERIVDMLTADPARWPGIDAPAARQRALMAVLQIESFLTVWLTGGMPVTTEDPLELLTDAVCHLLPVDGG